MTGASRSAWALGDVLPFVSPGPVYSVSLADVKDGLGFEISGGALIWMGGSDATFMPHVGGLYRGQHYSGGGESFARYTAAVEAGISFAGVELGYGFRDRGGDAKGVHVSPYLTALGLVYVGPQFLFPVNGEKVGVELNVGVKPLAIAAALLFALDKGPHRF